MNTLLKKPNLTEGWLMLFDEKHRDIENMEQLFGALSDHGCSFRNREEFTVREIFKFTMNN